MESLYEIGPLIARPGDKSVVEPLVCSTIHKLEVLGTNDYY
jgi:hypothetical protein